MGSQLSTLNSPPLWAVLGFLLGLLLTALFMRTREARHVAEKAALRDKVDTLLQLEDHIATERQKVSALEQRHAALEARAEAETKAAQEKLAVIEDARAQLTESFHALSAQALRANNQSFLDLAHSTLAKFQETAKGELEKRQQAIGELVKPVRESLEKVDAKIHEIEKTRVGAYESLTTQVRSLFESQTRLQEETGKLVRALRAPSVRGRWGEVQLRRVVELAGMTAHCDFSEQVSTTAPASGSEEAQRFRPDLIVKLPGGKTIIVDAKAVLSAYLDALEAPDDVIRAGHLQRHARQVRERVEELGRKAYWEQFRPAPEFVVLFLPGEMFFSAALENDPALIEFAAERKVVLATPTTLIALLKAIFYGWRQQALAENAQEISDLGRELYKRLAKMGEHLGKIGKNLNQAVGAYNDAVGTIETRVLVTARKFEDLHATPEGVGIDPLAPIEQITRQLQSPELLPEETLLPASPPPQLT